MEVKILLKRKLKRLSSFGISKNIQMWLIIILLVFIAFLIYNYMLIPQINLNGKKTIILNYNEKYIEKGYKATFLGKNITKKVKRIGTVNTKKIGEYKLVYQVKINSFSKTITRKVKVIDRKKPKLYISDTPIYLCPNDEVVPSKVKAIDDYDGDISNKIKIDIKKDLITYSVIDNSGNKSEISKKIFYKDIEKPKLKLKGSNYIYLFLNDEYKEEGFEVSDNCTKQLKDKVKIENNIDVTKTGEYFVTYSVKDDAKNETKIERKVIVSERNKEGTIYLTFDDGPKSGITNIILDILKEEGVKATFFVTNNGPDELIKRAYDEGHTIALHTASHNYANIYSSQDAYFNDLYTIQERVKKIIGYEAKIIRFPGGSSNTVSRKYQKGIMTNLTNEVINRGFKYYDWNISSGDASGGNHTKEEIASNVINSLRKDRINMVLMHDIKTYTRDALRQIIRYGKDNGYFFDKITMETEMLRQKINN